MKIQVGTRRQPIVMVQPVQYRLGHDRSARLGVCFPGGNTPNSSCMIRKTVLITMAFASLMGCKEEQKARADALKQELSHEHIEAQEQKPSSVAGDQD